MASVLSNAMKAQIKLLRPFVKKMNLKNERIAQDAIGLLGANALASKVEYAIEPFDKFEAEWALPIAKRSKAILYLHGGAYTCGTVSYAKGFGGVLAELTERSVLCVGYRLAPESPFPAAVDDAFESYLRMLKSFDASDIAVVGESAGGGLIFCLMQRLKEAKLPMPSALVALSPWADLTCSYPSYITNSKVDPSLGWDSLKFSARLYAKSDLKNPLVSPVYGDLSGLPRTLIIAGSDELLLDDTAVLTTRLRVSGVDCETHIEQGMWHVYVLFGIPEAKTALNKIKAFLK